MSTHRSLNKLEFQAHMSIHNITDVKDAERQERERECGQNFSAIHNLLLLELGVAI